MGFSDNNNIENIEAYLLGLLPNNIDKTEGSFTQTLVSLLAVESSQIASLMDVLLQQTNVLTMTDQFLDAKAYEYNLNRFLGAYATCNVTLQGVDNTEIAEGTVFATTSGLRFETQDTVMITNGYAQVTCIAEEIGTDYNISTNAITECVDTVIGLTSFTNTAATGGLNAEDDEALRQRILSVMQSPAASGNAAHYKQWAQNVEGVGDVEVIPVHAGPGTVKLVCKSESNTALPQATLDEITSYVSTQMPLGVSLTVATVANFTLNIVIAATYEAGSNATNMKPIIEQTITNYIQKLNSGDVLYYNRLLAEIVKLEGILDVSNFTLNSGKVNITIPSGQVATLGTVTVT